MTKSIPATGLFAHDIGKSFGGRTVLRSVSLSLRPGEIVGLLGPNGSGKTTFFGILTGLIPPDQGDIFLEGVSITQLPMYHRSRFGIGYLPQESSIFRGLTVEENILAVLEIYMENADHRRQRLEQLLDEFSIAHIRRASALSLSGGERRRVEIARALAANPRYLLLDEPLAGIDPIALTEVKELILHLRAKGLGVLITDHNVRETLDIVNSAYIINNGMVLAEGSVAEIIENIEVRRVYLGERFSI